MKLHWQILTALVLGVATGILLPEISTYISWLGDIFMNALNMLVVPIIFFSIVNSLSGIAQNRLKSIGIKTVLFYMLTMLIAALCGLLLVNLIEPGSAAQIAGGLAAVPENLTKSDSLLDVVVNYVPRNIFYAFTQNNTIPIIIIAFLTGLLLPKISTEGQSSLNGFFSGGLELTVRITKVIIRFSPFGIFAIVACQFGHSTDYISLLQTILLYAVTVSAGLAIHFFILLPLLLRYGFRVNPSRHLRNMSVPLLTAFSTASSSATLPLTLHAVEHKDGISPKVTNFTIPLGATINMDGTALLECVAVIFIAQAYGIDLSILQQALIVATSLVCAVGSAGIPMAALVMLALLLNVVGLPPEGIGLVIGVDRLLDMMRTAVNVYGDTCVAVMVAKSEGEKLPIDIFAASDK
jgi:Na+/H+-dicarboxylate symporter